MGDCDLSGCTTIIASTEQSGFRPHEDRQDESVFVSNGPPVKCPYIPRIAYNFPFWMCEVERSACCRPHLTSFLHAKGNQILNLKHIVQSYTTNLSDSKAENVSDCHPKYGTNIMFH